MKFLSSSEIFSQNFQLEPRKTFFPKRRKDDFVRHRLFGFFLQVCTVIKKTAPEIRHSKNVFLLFYKLKKTTNYKYYK